MKLYTYSHSSATHRVRIALNYKNIQYEAICLKMDDDALHAPEYLKKNPQGMVPALLDDKADVMLTQSLAIIEYLEEKYPERPLLPSREDIAGRARVRKLCQIIASDVHPLNCYRVFHYMRDHLDASMDQRTEWFHHWATEGYIAFERALTETDGTGNYCHGDHPTIADIVLVASVHRALAAGTNMTNFPNIRRIYRTCMTLAAFQAAAPETQPDAA